MATTPMFDPNGNIKDVATDQVDAAKGAGGQIAYNLLSPSGDSKWVRETDLPAAVNSGGLPANMSEARRIQAQLPKRSTAPEDSRMEDGLETLQNVGLVSPLQAGFIRKSARLYENYSDAVMGMVKKIPGADKVLDFSGSDAITRETKYMGATPPETGATSGVGRFAARMGDTAADMYGFMLTSNMLGNVPYVDKVKKLMPMMEDFARLPERVQGALTTFAKQAAAGGTYSLATNQTWKEALVNAIGTGSVAGLLDFALPGQGRVKPPAEEEAAAARQAGAQFTVKDTTQNAARNSLNKLNATRQPLPVAPESRMLPAPESQQPYTFDVETEGPEEMERVPGKMAVQARAKHIGAGVEERPGAEPTAPGRAVRKFPLYQYLTSARPGQEPIDAGLSGRGVLRLSSPEDAQLTLDRMDDLTHSPEFDEMSPEDQTRVSDQRDSLRQQLDMYHSYESQSPHFSPVPVDDIVSKISTPGEAAGQLRLAAQPVYQHLDEVSNGRFGELRRAEQNATELLRNRTLTAGEEAAEMKRLKDARDGMMEIFEKNRATINTKEWRAANDATRDAFVFDDIHTATERATNRIAPEDVKPGRPRLLTDQFTTQFSTLLNKPGMRADITRLLGNEGVDNMLDVSGILRDPKIQQPAMDLASEIGLHALKLAGPKGYAARAVLRMVMSRPAAGKLYTYALRNGIPARTAAPLIATALRGVEQQRNEEETEPTQ